MVTSEPDSPTRLSRAQRVAAHIEDEILDNNWSAGTRLGLRTDLMTKFDASPTVMNEALGILREHGMVEVRRGPAGGVFVATQPPHVRLGSLGLWFHHTNVSPAWMFELRVRVEDETAPMAYERMTGAHLATLERLQEVITTSDSAEEYLEAILDFHHILVQAAENSLLEEMHLMLLTVLRASLARAAFVEDSGDSRCHTVDIHRRIIDALRDRDREAFDAAMAAHHTSVVRSSTDAALIASSERRPIWHGLPEEGLGHTNVG